MHLQPLYLLLSLSVLFVTDISCYILDSASQSFTSFPTFDQYVKALDYPVETHFITTDDGYILTYFRIQAKGQKTLLPNLPVVFIHHGLLDSSDSWVLNNEDNAPGLLLANKGYDVWFGNSRGNKYSLGHITLKPSDPEFWQFTFQNMSHYDLPAAFEYIHLRTGQPINYVGHSQGTLIMFAALSDQEPSVLKYLRKYIALAPVAWVSHITAGPIDLIAHTDLAKILVDLKINQFMPSNFYESDFGHVFCKLFPKECGDLGGFIFGFDPQYDDYSRYGIFMEHEPSGTSVTNMLHWRQLVLTGKFNKYDYGIEGNMEQYGQPTPPDYNLGNINGTVHLFFGEDDDLVDEQDTQSLLNNLSNCKVDYKEYPADHVTWLLSKDISFYWDDFLNILENSDE